MKKVNVKTTNAGSSRRKTAARQIRRGRTNPARRGRNDRIEYFLITMVNGHLVRITPLKAPLHAADGKFKSPHGKSARRGGYCRWYGTCEFTTKGK